MDTLSSDGPTFETERLRVGPWAETATSAGIDLTTAISELLTATTTEMLPEEWHGDFDRDRAHAWQRARDAESPTLLAIDRGTSVAVGLVIVFEDASEPAPRDVRLGYLVGEAHQGLGFASELVAGLVAWARQQPGVASLSGGVAGDNPASASVLLKNGFRRHESPDHGSDNDELFVCDVRSGGASGPHSR